MMKKFLIALAFYIGSVAHAGDPGGATGYGYKGNQRAQRLTLTSDWTDNSGACTATNVTGFSFPVVSGTRYWIEANLMVTAAATTTGLGFSINGPAATNFSMSCFYPTATAASGMTIATINSVSCSASGSTTRAIVHCWGAYLPSSSGTAQVIAATEIDTSLTTIYTGSTLEYGW